MKVSPSYILFLSAPYFTKEAAVRLVKVRAETRTVTIVWVNIHSVALLWSGSWRYPAGDPAEEWTLKDKKKSPIGKQMEGAFARTEERYENSLRECLL